LDTVAMDRWAEMAIVSPLDTRRHDGFAAPARHRVAAREARLVPGTRLAFADLHNHSHLSDGDGDVEVAFDAMRDAGLDIGALTDHSRLGWGLPLSPVGSNGANPCRQLLGIDDDAWLRIGVLADAADRAGDFVRDPRLRVDESGARAHERVGLCHVDRPVAHRGVQAP
jgi:hypothetical protein